MATPGHSPPRLDQSSLSCVCRNAEKSELPRPECLSVAPVLTALPKHWDTPAWTHCKTHYGVRRRIVTPRSLPSRTSVSVESPHSGASAGRSGIGATLSPEAVPRRTAHHPEQTLCRRYQASDFDRRIALRPAHHKTDVAAATLRAHEPLAPIRHGRLGAVSLGHLGRVRLDLMTAILAPYDGPRRCCRASRADRARISSLRHHGALFDRSNKSPLPSF